MKQPLLILFLLLLGSIVQLHTQINSGSGKGYVPVVFQIGLEDDAYAGLSDNYPATLLAVCGDSMEKAYHEWLYLLQDMEDYGRKVDFNLNGIKVWLNVYWNKSGKIDYISFYPKPNSKNVPAEQIRGFLLSFARQYNSTLRSDHHFTHYGSATFPCHAKILVPKKP